MQKINFRNIISILRYQIIILVVILLSSFSSHAQFLGESGGIEQYKNRPYYFGITLGYNQAYLKMDYNSEFLKQDTLLGIDPLHSSGFNIGLLANLKLVDHLDLRFNPSLYFTNKDLVYIFKQGTKSPPKRVKKKIGSVTMGLPLQLKLKSDRVGRFRAYIMAGGHFDYDFAAESNARLKRDMLRLDKTDWGYEAGIGFEFYFPYFIFSPEIKFSYGTRDVHIYEPKNMYSNRIGRIISRMIVFSIHLEG